MDTKTRWTMARARQHLSKLVELAAREPQDVYRRDELVARVVGPAQAPPAKPSMADALAELQQVCAAENYTLYAPDRHDRPDPTTPRRPQRTTRPAARR